MKTQPSLALPVIRAAAAVDIITLLRRKGADTEEIFKLAGIDIQAPRTLYQYIELDCYTYLLELSAEQTNSPDFGLTIGSNQDPARWGAFGYLVLNSPTIGAALNNVAIFLKSWQTGTHIFYFNNGQHFGLEYSILHPKVTHRAQDAEVSMAYLKNLVNKLSGRSINPIEVCFEHSPVAELATYKALFGIIPLFDQPTNHISYPLSFENRVVTSADPQLFPVLQQHLVDTSLIDRCGINLKTSVNYYIRKLLPTQQCNLKQVAAALSLEPRTLQRRLKRKDAVFQEMVQAYRHKRATELLKLSKMEIKEISFILGFSDVSAFNKAFRKWTAMTPGRYRATHLNHSGTDGFSELSGTSTWPEN